MKETKILLVVLSSKSESRAWYEESVGLSDWSERTEKVDRSCFEAWVEENDFLCC